MIRQKNLRKILEMRLLLHWIDHLNAFGGAAAVWAFGLAFTHWGSYDVPFAVGAVTLLAAGIVSLSIKEKKDSVRYVQVPREVILSSDETTVAIT